MNHIFSEESVKIRKPHKCYGCGDKYEKGELLTVSKGITDGTFWSCYWCPICNSYIKSPLFHWEDHDDGIGPYELQENSNYEGFRKKFIEEFNKKQVLI